MEISKRTMGIIILVLSVCVIFLAFSLFQAKSENKQDVSVPVLELAELKNDTAMGAAELVIKAMAEQDGYLLSRINRSDLTDAEILNAAYRVRFVGADYLADFEYFGPDVRSEKVEHVQVKSTLQGGKRAYLMFEKYSDGNYYLYYID